MIRLHFEVSRLGLRSVLHLIGAMWIELPWFWCKKNFLYRVTWGKNVAETSIGDYTGSDKKIEGLKSLSMSKLSSATPFIPLNIAVLTVSDSRTKKSDESGWVLEERVTAAGHSLVDRDILPDDIYQIRAQISQWIIDSLVQVVIINGGTGLTGRDGTPEAISPLLDREIEGFGELFRSESYDKIGTSMLASRALGGVANGTFIFCIPGSPNACRDAWDEIFVHQLDSRHKPCNLAQLIPRLLET